MMKKILLIFSVLQMSISFSQYPTTDIYMLKMKPQKKQIKLSHLTKISDNEGYDNQPYFTPDGKDILFVSEVKGQKQTDVYQYHIGKMGKNKVNQVTNTPESEFSPKFNPKTHRISTVRIETDKDSTQRFWDLSIMYGKYYKALKEREFVISEQLKGIGYYDWINKDEAAVFIVGEKKHALYRFDTRFPAQKKQIHDNAGRAILKVPHKNAVTFVSKSETSWRIMQYNFDTDSLTEITATLPECEDFCWHPKGYLLAGDKGKLYAFYPTKKKDNLGWVQVADLAEQGIGEFYRLTVNKRGNRMAIVTFTGKKP